jgi:hypothetical protein
MGLLSAFPSLGIGKPEPLKFLSPGAWSRRLTQEHRIVYLVLEGRIDFLQARYPRYVLNRNQKTFGISSPESFIDPFLSKQFSLPWLALGETYTRMFDLTNYRDMVTF